MNTSPASSYTYTIDKTLSEFLKTTQFPFPNYYLYNIEFLIALNKNQISDDTLQSLKSLMRSLINGKQTKAGISNRDWFSSYFSGGFYKISIQQRSPEDFPTIHYHLTCFSDKNDLKDGITDDLAKRVKKILPEIEIGAFTRQPFTISRIKQIEAELQQIDSGFHFFSEPVRLLDKSVINWMCRMMHQPIQTFGVLYRHIHLSYLEECF